MNIPLGMSLPHRSPDPIDMTAVREVAQRAEALGFRDLWVTENAVDHVYSFDPAVVLTYAGAVTTKIRLGVAVSVLPIRNPIHVAHQVATLDYVSNGRAILGVGLGRDHHYAEFQIPTERRVRRFKEGVELIKALWTEPKVTYRGDFYKLDAGTMVLKPVQKPHPPIWLGGDHPEAVRRAATVADGWMGSGRSRALRRAGHPGAVDRRCRARCRLRRSADLGDPLLAGPDVLRSCRDPRDHHALSGPVRASRRVGEAHAGKAAGGEPGRILERLPRRPRL